MASNYEQLVKALRHCMTKEDGITICEPCPYYGKGIDCEDVLHTDAASAIEELQADNVEMLHELEDAAKQIRELQDEVLSYASGSQPHWVSVEDSMPDLLQFVLVCNDEGKCVVAQYVVIKRTT